MTPSYRAGIKTKNIGIQLFWMERYRKNPDPEHIPCFRVVNGKGELAGEFAFGGEGGQTRLLEEDGIPVENGRVDLEKYGITLRE